MNENHELHSQIFYGRSLKERESVKREGGQFAYYTTAETALLILENNEIWLRNTRVMNDYNEVSHGIECLRNTLANGYATPLLIALSKVFPGCATAEELAARLDKYVPDLLANTFIVSLSVHQEDESETGRLSMWRAYGGRAGVALVVNCGPFFRPSKALGAYTHPVNYDGEKGVTEEWGRLATEIRNNSDYLQSLGQDYVLDELCETLGYLAVCTKHRAFREEKEWRVIATLKAGVDYKGRVALGREIIGGVPQMVLKIKLEDVPNQGLTGLHPRELLDRVLIGPTDHAETICVALWSVMQEVCQIPNPTKLLWNTQIPLRPNQR